ncbi:MAG: hypothetical protein HYV62_07930 [Candidatus Rokubacteria bacterium]|nr:hypothetical protein [Candidatus Rokubacteria bacterium]
MRGLLLVVALLGLVPASIAAADEAGDPPWVVAVDGVPIDVLSAEIGPVEVAYGVGKEVIVIKATRYESP